MGTIATTSAATLAVNLGLDPTAGTKANSVTVTSATAPDGGGHRPWILEPGTRARRSSPATMTLQVNGYWIMESVASGGAAWRPRLRTAFSGSISGAGPAGRQLRRAVRHLVRVGGG